MNSFIGRNSANKIHHHRKKKLLKGKRRFLKIRRTNIRVCGFLYQEGCHVHVQVPADITLIDSLLKSNFVPVLSPVGVDTEGNTYNINADYAASAIAGALSAQKLIFLTDVEGILKDKDDPASILRTLSKQQALSYIADGTIKGGMIPKVQCCIDGLEKGVESVHVLDGRVSHAILLEIFTTKGIGTMVTDKESV